MAAVENQNQVSHRSHRPLEIPNNVLTSSQHLAAYAPFFQTSSGIGPGTSITRVAALTGFHPDFCEYGYWNGTASTSPTDIVTVFTRNGGIVASVLIGQLRLYTACAAGSQALAPTV